MRGAHEKTGLSTMAILRCWQKVLSQREIKVDGTVRIDGRLEGMYTKGQVIVGEDGVVKEPSMPILISSGRIKATVTATGRSSSQNCDSDRRSPLSDDADGRRAKFQGSAIWGHRLARRSPSSTE